MIAVPGARRYYVYSGVTDMRKSFNGLGGLVRDRMQKELRSGDVFVFINRRRTMIKAMMWDRSGFVIYYKRLEKGTFEFPEKEEIEWSQLVMILEGVRLKGLRRRLRYAV